MDIQGILISFVMVTLTNLILSCDNLAVIAIATRNLPGGTAVKARLLGIWLAIALKFILLVVAGILLSNEGIPVRLGGGLLLLWIIYSMLRGEKEDDDKLELENARSEKLAAAKHPLAAAVTTIIVADMSMSLDNVLAIIASAKEIINYNSYMGYGMLIVSLIVCVPLLLWFSEILVRVLNRFPVLINIFGGYLVYIAMEMIFEDRRFLAEFFSLMDGFFANEEFPTRQIAIGIGILVMVITTIVTLRKTAIEKKARLDKK